MIYLQRKMSKNMKNKDIINRLDYQINELEKELKKIKRENKIIELNNEKKKAIIIQECEILKKVS